MTAQKGDPPLEPFLPGGHRGHKDHFSVGLSLPGGGPQKFQLDLHSWIQHHSLRCYDKATWTQRAQSRAEPIDLRGKKTSGIP